ncbi:MAG: response regulator [Candidatus Hodarchaeota archaeon]
MKTYQDETDFLVIEDDSDTIKILKEFFKSKGYTYKYANSVRKGLEILKNCTPSIILLDILLPDRKGYEIINSIKSNTTFHKVRIYFLTAVHQDEVQKKVDEYHIDGIIEKPFNLREFEALFEILKNKNQ